MILLAPKSIINLFVLLTLGLLVGSCGNRVPTPGPSPTGSTLPDPTATSTPLPFTPTPTSIPLAALINGEAITLEEFQAELVRFKSSQSQAGTNLATMKEEQVLEDLIDQILLSQAAQETGFLLEDGSLQARMQQLVEQAGGAQVFVEWMAEHNYSEESFKKALKRAVTAAWMRDQIISLVPATAEQIHARQILTYDLDEANRLLARIKAGESFTALSVAYDPVMEGELGWFPRGYLMEVALEDAAFALQPGEYSDIVETRLGYHIIQVIEREPLHPLTPDARLVLQQQTLLRWLADRRSQSDIQIYSP